MVHVTGLSAKPRPEALSPEPYPLAYAALTTEQNKR